MTIYVVLNDILVEQLYNISISQTARLLMLVATQLLVVYIMQCATSFTAFQIPRPLQNLEILCLISSFQPNSFSTLLGTMIVEGFRLASQKVRALPVYLPHVLIEGKGSIQGPASR